MTDMRKALDAIEGNISLAENKEPAKTAKIVVAVQLSREAEGAGRYMIPVKAGWRPRGLAVAIMGGRVIAANPVFGRISSGVPKVVACHYVECACCHHRELTPVAAWAAKDAAAAAGRNKEEFRGMTARGILSRFGKCPKCGGGWGAADAYEKEVLSSFAEKVMKDISALEEKGESLPEFIKPRGFVVRPVEEAVDLGPQWRWLGEAMAAAFKAAVPAENGTTGSLIVYNPGYWFGTVANRDETELFFHEGPAFTPGAVAGL